METAQRTFETEVIQKFRDQMWQDGETYKEIANRFACSRSYIHQVLSLKKNPSPRILGEMVKRIKIIEKSIQVNNLENKPAHQSSGFGFG